MSRTSSDPDDTRRDSFDLEEMLLEAQETAEKVREDADVMALAQVEQDPKQDKSVKTTGETTSPQYSSIMEDGRTRTPRTTGRNVKPGAVAVDGISRRRRFSSESSSCSSVSDGQGRMATETETMSPVIVATLVRRHRDDDDDDDDEEEKEDEAKVTRQKPVVPSATARAAMSRRCIVGLVLGAVLLFAAITTGIVLAIVGMGGDDKQQQSPAVQSTPTASPTPFSFRAFTNTKELYLAVNEYLVNNSPDTYTAQQYGHPIGTWNVSLVTDFSRLFASDRTASLSVTFNEDITEWDTSRAVDMTGLFDSVEYFNQPIGKWDVSKVLFMDSMFFAATRFNQPLASWNVSSCQSMTQMFQWAMRFNSSIGNWDMSSVQNVDLMFYGASSFNQPLGDWDMSSFISIEGLFSGANSFNQDVSSWDVSSVENFAEAFYLSGFNLPIGSWNTSSATSMRGKSICCFLVYPSL